MAKLATLVDAFTAATINTTLWNSITGAATLDTVNDQVSLAVPTVNGTTNAFGTSTTWDATASSFSAQITVGVNGNGGVATQIKLAKDASNHLVLKVASGGVFSVVNTTAGTPVTKTLPAYSPDAHRWWRISESGGVFTIAAGADGLNWTTLATVTYTWSATAVTVAFQTVASVTEAAGNVAVIAHVNTSLGGQWNPNWPRTADEWAPYWSANGGAVPADRYVDVTARTRNGSSISRGRQYELDQVRSGSYSTDLANTDAALDPTNASGPYAGHVLPYQPYRKRAQWPPTVNMLTQVQATGGDLGGEPTGVIDGTVDGPSVFSDTDATGGSFVTSASAWQGTTAGAFAVSGTSTATQWIAFTRQAGVLPGQAYTVQLRVRNVTAATSVQVAAGVRTRTAADVAASTAVGTTATLAGSATAAWTTVTATGTAASTAGMLLVGVQVVTAPGSACVVQVDGWQLETGSTASAWVCPGTWYPLFAGFVEDWASQWSMSGTYGTITPSIVDAFALLSQRTLPVPLTAEIQSHSPRFVYALGDPAGSTSAAEASGAYPALPVTNGKNGASSIAFGTAITATDPVNGVFTGSDGTVAHFANPNPGQLTYGPCTYLSLTAAGITGPANPTGPWSRTIAFRYTGAVPTYAAYLTMSADNQRTGGNVRNGSELSLVINASSQIQVNICGPAGGTSTGLVATAPTVTDGNWHLVMLVYNPVTATLVVRVDTTVYTFISIAPSVVPTGLTMESIGAWVDNQIRYTTGNFAGEIAFFAEFPVALTPADRNNLYTAWLSSCAGESTDTRYARILRYAGYGGASNIQTGLTTSMGPAAFGGQDAVTALQGVVDTEGGAHFVDQSGAVTFRSRSARYNAFTPIYTFGERADLGEWPYEDCGLDYDSTHLGNVVSVTQDSTSQVFTAQDAASIAAYFPRSLSRSVNSSSSLECQDAASYLLSRYKQPATRVSTLKLHPSANSAMWPMCFALELGTRVRVMRRPPGVPAIQVECFVENAQWGLDDNGEATLTLQCSPADLTPYAIFSAWHTTFALGALAGVSSITVNASQDTTIPLANQLPVGTVLALGPDTPAAETVTILAVGNTSPGWTTAVITLTAPTTKAHSSLDSVCEALPAGITAPNTYDASSAFDTTAFAY